MPAREKFDGDLAGSVFVGHRRAFWWLVGGDSVRTGRICAGIRRVSVMGDSFEQADARRVMVQRQQLGSLQIRRIGNLDSVRGAHFPQFTAAFAKDARDARHV